MLVNKGHMRLYAEKATGRFIGAEIVGPAAEHLAHLLAWAHQMKMTVPQMLDMPFYHPLSRKVCVPRCAMPMRN